MEGYELIDHTADIGIRVWGKDVKDIFLKAAQAMFDVIAQKPRSLKNLRRKKINIHLKAENIEELLVAFSSDFFFVLDYFPAFCLHLAGKMTHVNITDGKDRYRTRRLLSQIDPFPHP